jgi:predicted RND superfamily exporter protein
MDLRDRIESRLERFGHSVYRRAWWVIAGFAVVVGAAGSQLPDLRIDPSMESFLHETDPIRVTYDRFRERFGRSDRVLIAIEADDVFDGEFLKRLRALHTTLEEEVPRVTEVTSLINSRSTRGLEDELIVEDLFEEWPETPEALAEIRERGLGNPLLRNLVLSEDARITVVVVELDTFSSSTDDDEALAGFDDLESSDPSNGPPKGEFADGEDDREAVLAIQAVIERYRHDAWTLHQGGTPTMNDRIQTLMRGDMGRFTSLSLLSIGAFLGVLFRRVGAVVLPLVVVVLSVATTLAVMAMSGTAIMPPTQVLPTFLLAVGIGGCVHVLAIFFQSRRRGAGVEASIAHALGHSGLAIIMTALTTAGGLSSFAAAELAPISHFGTYGPLGVLIALVFTIVLLPALLAIFPIRPPEERDESESGDGARLARSQRTLVGCGNWCIDHAGLVVGISAGLVVVAILGAAQLRFSFNPMDWFPDTESVKIANTLLNDETKGSIFLEVLLDTGVENGLHEPETLELMDEMRRQVSSGQIRDLFVGKTISLVDVIKEIHQALNENRSEFYAIPGDRTLVAQELLLFENSGSDDLEDVCDSRFQVGRFTMKLPFVDAAQYGPFIARIETLFEEILEGRATITTTGIMAIMGRTISAVIRTMATSYVIAFLIVAPLLVLIIGQLRLGVLAIIPNLTPILLTLGVMGWTGIPLNPFTILTGSIALGLAVDDTIHFMHNFRRYYARSGDLRGSVRETLMTTGQALFFTSLVLSTGFFVFTFATMGNLFHFGLLTGMTVILAFLADIMLAPALMGLAYRNQPPAAEVVGAEAPAPADALV